MHYEDGGHAFPRKGSDSNEPEQASWQSGMTLRDYFAAAALGMEGIAVKEAADIAKRAYLIADALITER